MSRFQEELDIIQERLNELNNLYSETKTHFDAIKKSNSRNTLSFIHLQTSNLISLNNAIISSAKDSFNIKKVEAELELKTKSSNMGAEQEEMLKQLYEKMMNDTSIVPTEDREDEFEDEYYDDDVDSQLDALADNFEKEGAIEFNNELEDEGYGKLTEIEDSYEEEYDDDEEFQPQKALIVVLLNGKKWSFGAINEDGELLEDYPLPNKKDFKMKLKKVDGEIVAYDQNEKIYRVIK